jgi:tetratricopeptide (TPR) repeat protein
MDSFEVKRNLESGRGRLEIVNAGGSYMCYIDDHTNSVGNKRICLIGEIKSANYGNYDISGIWDGSIDSLLKSKIKELHGPVEFSNLGPCGPYKVTNGKFEDLAVVMAAYGSGSITQWDLERDLENRIREEEQNRLRAEQEHLRSQAFDTLLNRLNLDFKRKDWEQYIDDQFRLMNEFKDRLRITKPFEFNYNLGYAFAQVGNPKESLRWYKKAFKVKKRADLYLVIAGIYEDLNPDKAIKWYKSGRKVEDNLKYNKWIINKVASIYLKKINGVWGSRRKVIKYFDQLAKWLGITRLNAPLSELKKMVDSEQRKDVLYSLARDYSKRGNLREGMRHYNMLVDSLHIRKPGSGAS